ncbi:hypothetical protein [Cohnella sp. GCM10012308]|uniref:hypothetical protein n=1 Tax=Cohnella sp. GCM10012308 TaxID=3317329 RepID=UPI00360CC579
MQRSFSETKQSSPGEQASSLVYEAIYRGMPSVVLETDQIRAELIPGIGAKIVSLVYKPTKREWLIDAGTRELRRLTSASSFGEADLSGWDECFPTVSPCPGDEEGKLRLPDHGEVWPLAWARVVGADSVSCSASGIALPYRLSRTIVFEAADTMRLNYFVENSGSDALPFLWVPHPQFIVPEPTRIMLPSAVREMLCVFGGDSRQAGKRYRWTGESLVLPAQTGDGRKFYVPGQLAEGWCGLVGESSGDWLRMDVNPQSVPYLGVWIDEGIVNDRNVIALEPSIGYYDSLDRAIANGTAAVVQPGGSCEWSLRLRLGTGGITSGFAE